MYAVLTGRPPFSPGDDRIMDTVRKVLDESPVPPRKRRSRPGPEARETAWIEPPQASQQPKPIRK